MNPNLANLRKQPEKKKSMLGADTGSMKSRSQYSRSPQPKKMENPQ